MSLSEGIFWGLALLTGYGLIVWLIQSLRVVKATEAAVVTTFGKPVRAVGSGLQFVFYPFQQLTVFPTTRQELEFETKILTKKDPSHSAVNVRVHLSLRFRYPARKSNELGLLLDTVKVLDRLDKDYLTTLFEEPVVDIVEEVCQEFNWEDLYHNRSKFNEYMINELESVIQNYDDNILVESQSREIDILLTNLELPPDLEKAISKPETASLDAEAEARRIRKVAEAKADATVMAAEAEEKRVKQVYGGILGRKKWTEQEGLAIRGIEGREEMAQGEGVYIVSDDLASGLATSIPVAHILGDQVKGGGKKPKK